MIKPLVLALSCATAGAIATGVYVGRTEYSTSLHPSIPFGSAIKVTTDPANVWSWHHTFANVSPSSPQTADVLVDINGDLVMDTNHAFVRVLITDFQLVGTVVSSGIARIIDSQGKRLAAGIGGFQGTGHVQHVNLATPIVLPVGSTLRVEVESTSGSNTFEVNMVGRVVNL